MDLRRLSTLLMGAGLLMSVAAFFWWLHFYGDLTKNMNVDLSQAYRCLYASSGACGLVSGISQMAGATPYEPALLWVGVIAFIAGVFLRASLRRTPN